MLRGSPTIWRWLVQPKSELGICCSRPISTALATAQDTKAGKELVCSSVPANKYPKRLWGTLVPRTPRPSNHRGLVCVWTIWKDVKLLTCLMMCFNGFPIWHCLFGFFIWFSNKSRGQGLQWLPCPTKLCHWRGSNWGRPVVYLQIVFNCWTRCPLRCYSFSGRILIHCFSRLVIHHLLSGLLECFLHVRCIPHQ